MKDLIFAVQTIKSAPGKAGFESLSCEGEVSPGDFSGDGEVLY
jgi:hypothetical protein